MIYFYGNTDMDHSCADVDIRGEHSISKCIDYDDLNTDQKAKFDAVELLVSKESLKLTDFGDFDAYFDLNVDKTFELGNVEMLESEMTQAEKDSVNDFINMIISL